MIFNPEYHSMLVPGRTILEISRVPLEEKVKVKVGIVHCYAYSECVKDRETRHNTDQNIFNLYDNFDDNVLVIFVLCIQVNVLFERLGYSS